MIALVAGRRTLIRMDRYRHHTAYSNGRHARTVVTWWDGRGGGEGPGEGEE